MSSNCSGTSSTTPSPTKDCSESGFYSHSEMSTSSNSNDNESEVKVQEEVSGDGESESKTVNKICCACCCIDVDNNDKCVHGTYCASFDDVLTLRESSKSNPSTPTSCTNGHAGFINIKHNNDNNTSNLKDSESETVLVVPNHRTQVSRSNSDPSVPSFLPNILGLEKESKASTSSLSRKNSISESELALAIQANNANLANEENSENNIPTSTSCNSSNIYTCSNGTRPESMAQSTSSNSSSSISSNGGNGTKFKLIYEGDLQVCKVKHDQTLLSKISTSKLLRRWETHHLYLNDNYLSSKTPVGVLSRPISYWQMEDVFIVSRLDPGKKYIIRILLPDGSLLLQAPNGYVRDQWYHSILWKKNILKYQNLIRSSRRSEVILKELKSLINFAKLSPLQDDTVTTVPVEIVTNLLESAGDLLGQSETEEVLLGLSPLLEKSHPPPSLCRYFSKYCVLRPRSPLIGQLLSPVVRRELKHNVDFGKHPHMRRFIQDFFLALSLQNDGINAVRNFVKSLHGPGSSCPHPKVMSNLVSVSLAVIFGIFEKNNTKRAAWNLENPESVGIPWDEQLVCFLAVFDTISKFEDWRPNFSQLLQPIPFPGDAFSNPLFTKSMASVIERIGTDSRCEVHQTVMGIRDGKEGWFHIYSPSYLSCSDDFDLCGKMLERLLDCCYKRKRFLVQLGENYLDSCLLLALREHSGAQAALCLLLEWNLVSSEDQRVQIATTLQSTHSGSVNYTALCSRQMHLKELQQKGGPRKLTLPSHSTDSDLAKLLSCGSLGNLDCLSLAFTQVTSRSAEQLIKLPSLRYLNLWSTQFNDSGLQLISEHLTNLQVLNLCETPVTDKGILSLTNLTSLRKLNLNSTNLSGEAYAVLRKNLPNLKEIDIKYTEAW